MFVQFYISSNYSVHAYMHIHFIAFSPLIAS